MARSRCSESRVIDAPTPLPRTCLREQRWTDFEACPRAVGRNHLCQRDRDAARQRCENRRVYPPCRYEPYLRSVRISRSMLVAERSCLPANPCGYSDANLAAFYGDRGSPDTDTGCESLCELFRSQEADGRAIDQAALDWLADQVADQSCTAWNRRHWRAQRRTRVVACAAAPSSEKLLRGPYSMAAGPTGTWLLRPPVRVAGRAPLEISGGRTERHASGGGSMHLSIDAMMGATSDVNSTASVAPTVHVFVVSRRFLDQTYLDRSLANVANHGSSCAGNTRRWDREIPVELLFHGGSLLPVSCVSGRWR
jgi:hypothetical protein